MTTRYAYLDRILWLSDQIPDDAFNWTASLNGRLENRIVSCKSEDLGEELQRSWQLGLSPVIVQNDNQDKTWTNWALSAYPFSILFWHEDSEVIEELLYAPSVKLIELLEAEIKGQPHDQLKVVHAEIGAAFARAYFTWQAQLDPEDEDNRILLSKPTALEILIQSKKKVQAEDKVVDFLDRLFATISFSQTAMAAGKNRGRVYEKKHEVNDSNPPRSGIVKVIIEYLPKDPDHQMLVFECGSTLKDDFCGKSVVIKVGENSYSLGRVDRRGIAQAEVPRDIDLSAGYEVNFYTSNES
jgi:hypothetical protein